MQPLIAAASLLKLAKEEPVLEHWQDGRQAKANTKGPAPLPLKVKAQWVDWKPEQGDLKAPAVVRGERFEPTEPAKTTDSKTPSPSLVLTAQGLKGNLREGYVDLVAPVKLRRTDGKGWLDAQQTRWAINDQQLSSDKPFKGQFNALQAKGDRFAIDLEKSDVKVSRGCELEQPGERLTATRCIWNWPSGRFEATDQVVLKRDTYKQVTRAKRLEGKIGDDGTAVFSSPVSLYWSKPNSWIATRENSWRLAPAARPSGCATEIPSGR